MEHHSGEKWPSLKKLSEIFCNFTENSGNFEVALVVFINSLALVRVV